MPSKIGSLIQDLRGVGKLAAEATAGVADLVEAVHRNLSPAQAALANPATSKGRTRGITGMVYRSIRGVTRAAGAGIDGGLSALSAVLDTPPTDVAQTRARATVQSALNGVLGDYLVATANPLAIPMQLRYVGANLSEPGGSRSNAAPDEKLLILVHGLCMSDQQWLRHDHDHGAALARDLGYTPAYLLYNTGQHISVNGRLLADLIEATVLTSKNAPTELVLLGHSMGGLVIRSACHYGALAGHSWRGLPLKIICMGSPHHGAPLERGGAWIDAVLGATPLLAPFARLGKIRSAGITDLRYGNVIDEDWMDQGTRRNDVRQPTPLPEDVACYAIAATTGAREGALTDRLLGDGLVPLASALGRHPRRSFALRFTHSWIGYRMNHLDLFDRPEVYKQLVRWLGEA